LEALIGWCSRMIKNWTLLNKPKEVVILEAWVVELAKRSVRPPRLPWRQKKFRIVLTTEIEEVLTANINVSGLEAVDVIHVESVLNDVG
jgi:hypothetical protein